jgi:hypothetical protein
MAMECDALVFGASMGIVNATFTANAEAMRHEKGTASGLVCDCEKVLRATAQIRVTSDAMPQSTLPISVSAEDFGVVVGIAVCTSREVTFSRDAFVQDSATYDLVTSPNLCANVEADSGEDPDSNGCPQGWSTLGHLVNGSYTENRELLRHEVRSGDGTPGNPLLTINALFTLRRTVAMSATFERNPLEVAGIIDILEGSPSNWQALAGCRVTMTLSSADGNRVNSASGIVTSCEMSKSREGWSTWTVNLESQHCGE